MAYRLMIAVMYVTRVPNRGSPPAVLLRESYREDGKVKNRTLANLSSLARGQGRRAGAGAERPAAGWGWPRHSRSPAACRTGMWPRCWARARALGLEELIDPAPSRQRDLVTAMVVAR